MVNATEIPLEVLEQIAQASDSVHGLSALLRTCRPLYAFTDHFLYRQNKKRKRALTHALKHDIYETLQRVLRQPGTRITIETVVQACRYGRLDTVKAFLARPGLMAELARFSDEVGVSKGYSPLYMASRYGHADVVEYLLSMPVTGVNALSGARELTALHGAVEGDCDDERVVKLLITASKRLIERRGGPNRVLPIDFAVQCNSAVGLRILLDAGAAHEGYESWKVLTRIAKESSNAYNMSEVLLQRGAPASGMIGPYEKPLALAAQRGLDDLVGLLLRHGADPRSGSINGSSGLGSVLVGCRLETCKMFAASGGLPPEILANRLEIARAAAISGDTAKMTWVLDEPIFQKEGGQPVLDEDEMRSVLCAANSRDVAALLMARGAGPSSAEDGHWLLFKRILDNWTIHHQVRVEVLLVLLENGLDLSNDKDKLNAAYLAKRHTYEGNHMEPVFIEAGMNMDPGQYRTLLFDAVRGYERNRISPYMIRALVRRGADINAVDHHGETVVFRALRYHHYKCLPLLLSLNPDIHHANVAGNTLLHLIRVDKGGADERAAAQLLGLGLDPNARNARGFMPVDGALRFGSPALLALHVRAGAAVTALRKITTSSVAGAGHAVRVSTMHLAVVVPGRREATRGLETLIALGVDVDVRDDKKRTPLHWARSRGAGRHARLLIKAGADVFAKDKNGVRAGKVRVGQYPDLITVYPSLGHVYDRGYLG